MPTIMFFGQPFWRQAGGNFKIRYTHQYNTDTTLYHQPCVTCNSLKQMLPYWT